MKAMRPSTVILKIARRHPSVARIVAALLGLAYKRNGQTHWLVRHLQDIARTGDVRILPVGHSYTIQVPRKGWLSIEFDKHGGYEPVTSEVCRAILRPGMVAIDVGANAGYFSLLFAECVGVAGQVVAFEPSPDLFGALQENLKRNETRHVMALQRAISGATGCVPLYYSTSEVTHSLRRTKLTTELTEWVDASTLDSVVNEYGLRAVDLIKIDTEGAELHVLQGSEQTLSRHSPYVIVEASEWCSSFGYAPAELATFLRKLGYQVLPIDQLEIAEWSGDLQGATHINLLGIPRSHVHRVDELRAVIERLHRAPNSAADRTSTIEPTESIS